VHHPSAKERAARAAAATKKEAAKKKEAARKAAELAKRQPPRTPALPARPPAPTHAPAPTAPVSTAAPTAGAPMTATTGPRVTRQGQQLFLDGRPWRFTGFNAYGAATDWGLNWGCGAPSGDLDQMFTTLPAGSVVRFWAFQAQAWNNKASPQHLDFSAIDRVVAAAERHHQLLIMTLSDQSGTCDDGHWHDPAWYEGAYTQRFNDDGRGLGSLSYADYVTTIVNRYRTSPAIAFWEPVNEPESSTCSGATGAACFDNSKRSCPHDSAQILAGFYDAIGRQIRAIEPTALISDGVSGGGQCGTTSGDYDVVGKSSGVDLLTYHDYGSNDNAFPSGLADRLRQARTEIGKPLSVEEAGIGAGPDSGCRSRSGRATAFADKIHAAFTSGAVGYTPWWYSPAPSGCGDDFGPADPLVTVLATALTG